MNKISEELLKSADSWAILSRAALADSCNETAKANFGRAADFRITAKVSADNEFRLRELSVGGIDKNFEIKIFVKDVNKFITPTLYTIDTGNELISFNWLGKSYQIPLRHMQIEKL